MAHEYVKKVLERERIHCRKMYKRNLGNQQDTGYDYYTNAMRLWEEREIELNDFMVYLKERNVREYEFEQILKSIEDLVKEFRSDYFQNDVLAMLDNRLINLLVRWRQGRP